MHMRQQKSQSKHLLLAGLTLLLAVWIAMPGLAGIATERKTTRIAPTERRVINGHIPGTRADWFATPSPFARGWAKPTMPAKAVYRADGDDDVPTLYGIAVSDSYTLVSFPATSAFEFNAIKASSGFNASGSAVYVDGRYYVIQLNALGGITIGATKYTWDADTWELIDTDDQLWASSAATDMTFDPTTGLVYGQFFSADLDELYWGTLDVESGSMTQLSRNMDDRLYAIAAAPSGVVYAINQSGKLVTVNKDNGTLAEVGNTGVMPKYIQSMTIDEKTGRCYWAAMTEDAKAGLYEVDLETGAATLIGAMPGNSEVCGLFIPETISGDAPAKVDTATLNFRNGSLSGRLEFDLPTTTVAGDRMTEMVYGYAQVTNSEGISDQYSDMDAAGGEMSMNVTVPYAGMYNFKVWASNSAGEGPKYRFQAWIGPDAPQAVTNLGARLQADGSVVVSWDAPTRGVHDGYVDWDAVTYRVVCVNDGEVIADNLTATTVTDMPQVSGSKSVQYSVTPQFGTLTGPTAYTPTVMTSDALEVPATVNFVQDWDLCTVIDANADGVTWTTSPGGFVVYSGEELDGDDWIITPAIHLVPGRQYNVQLGIAARNGVVYYEKFELKAGQGNTVDAMTATVLPEQGIPTLGSMLRIDTTFVASADGNYNFGVHAMSSASWRQMRLYSLTVTEGSLLTAPQAVANLTATAAGQGQLSATLAFNAPALDLNGDALAALGKIEVANADGQVLSTVVTPVPGAALTCDVPAVQGDNTYVVTPYGSDGEAGKAAQVTVYCGVDVPSYPTDVTLSVQNNRPHLTWQAPVTGENGGYINPALLTYDVLGSLWEDLAATGLTATQWTDNWDATTGDQTTLYYGVRAVNAAGQGSGMISNVIVAGANYTLPFVENFPYGGLNNECWIMSSADGEAEWGVSRTEGFDSPLGCARFDGYSGGSQALVTGKVSLAGAQVPVLDFRVMGDPSSDDRLDVLVSDEFEGQYMLLKSVQFSGTNGEWQHVVVDLSQFKDLDHVHIAFMGAATTYMSTIWLDEVRIDEQREHDLVARHLTASKSRVMVGESHTELELSIENRGTAAVAAADYQVSVLRNGELLQVLEGVDIASDAMATVSCTYVPDNDDDSDLEFVARIDYAADQDPASNTSEAVTVQVDKQQWPAVDDLQGEGDGGIAKLTWSQPDLSGTPESVVTEGFEAYNSFDIEKMGSWTLADVDQSYTYDISGFYWENATMPQSWIVFAPAEVEDLYGDGEPLSSAWDPHSGEKYAASFACYDGLNDDWLITPELSGNAQQVSFWAKSANDYYGMERFEVYYSTTDTNVESFTALAQDFEQVPAAWTEYSYSLPEGAKYFAIRCVSPNRFCLMVDDVTFECAPQPLDVEFVGYNVYRNGVLVNEAPVTVTHFETAFDSEDKFTVRVVYDKGLSASSNVVTLIASGIAAPEADTQAGDLYDLQGRKVQAPVEGEIYVTKGKKIIWRAK